VPVESPVEDLCRPLRAASVSVLWRCCSALCARALRLFTLHTGAFFLTPLPAQLISGAFVMCALRPAWAWRPEPLALAGGALPETVCSHLGGAGGGAWQLLQFLDRWDAAALRLVCAELRDMAEDFAERQRSRGSAWVWPMGAPTLCLYSGTFCWHDTSVRPVLYFLRYQSSWSLPLLRSDATGWKDVALREESPGCWTIRMVWRESRRSPRSAALLCVLSDGAGQWDNPEGGGNYCLPAGGGCFSLQQGSMRSICSEQCPEGHELKGLRW
jgi:hypothetical protein